MRGEREPEYGRVTVLEWAIVALLILAAIGGAMAALREPLTQNTSGEPHDD